MRNFEGKANGLPRTAHVTLATNIVTYNEVCILQGLISNVQWFLHLRLFTPAPTLIDGVNRGSLVAVIWAELGLPPFYIVPRGCERGNRLCR